MAASSRSTQNLFVALGHPTSYFVTRALLWSVAIVAVFAPLAVKLFSRE